MTTETYNRWSFRLTVTMFTTMALACAWMILALLVIASTDSQTMDKRAALAVISPSILCVLVGAIALCADMVLHAISERKRP